MAQDKITPPPRAPMRPGLRALLIGSLAVNLIVLGLALGAVFGQKQGGDRAPRDADFMGAYTRALPDDTRRDIGRAIRRHHRTSGISRDAARAAYQEMLSLMRATPFDVEAIKAQLDAQARASYDRRDAAQEIWLKAVSEMSDAERAVYADEIERLLTRPKSGKPARN
ncbi:periplasmic heavy metal sensor [Cognatishimia sp. SS12]|uniref:periplasmic heavy metal sensor n=1 Tax=Cognatishimia sp. SS12 TaxID=2979465 RepID=UPI0023309DC4|nr:periplasmic heavy metal sensor [Cognatishimia sp. SS12]MDC0736688.1 periplasmic heavy metal sensor [Cognatishimia sp. SS12]